MPDSPPISRALLTLQFTAGLLAFFLFFAGLFNGLDQLAHAAAAGGLLYNVVASALVARRGLQRGVIAAAAFAGPAGAFAAFSLGDLLMAGNVKPFLFWAPVALVAAAAGLLGVGLTHLVSGR